MIFRLKKYQTFKAICYVIHHVSIHIIFKYEFESLFTSSRSQLTALDCTLVTNPLSFWFSIQAYAR